MAVAAADLLVVGDYLPRIRFQLPSSRQSIEGSSWLTASTSATKSLVSIPAARFIQTSANTTTRPLLPASAGHLGRNSNQLQPTPWRTRVFSPRPFRHCLGAP